MAIKSSTCRDFNQGYVLQAHCHPCFHFPVSYSGSFALWFGEQKAKNILTHSVPSLFSANFVSLLDQIKSDFKKWRILPLSLIGRINGVKMNTVPRFLFLFQCIQVFLSKTLNHLFFFKGMKGAPDCQVSWWQIGLINQNFSRLGWKLSLVLNHLYLFY